MDRGDDHDQDGPIGEDGLGEVVLSCRGRRLKDVFVANGTAGPATVWLLPLWFSIATLVLLGGLCLWMVPDAGSWPLSTKRWASGVAYVGGAAIWAGILARRPRRPALVLHDRGIRYKRHSIPFRGVEEITLGRDVGGIERGLMSVNRTVGAVRSYNRAVAKRAEVMIAASLTVLLKDGESVCLRAIAILVEPEELRAILDRIRADHPSILRSGESDEAGSLELGGRE